MVTLPTSLPGGSQWFKPYQGLQRQPPVLVGATVVDAVTDHL